VEQKAKCEDIHEPRPSIIGLKVCLDSNSLNFLNVYMPYCCDSNYDEYINYPSKISTLFDEIDSS